MTPIQEEPFEEQDLAYLRELIGAHELRGPGDDAACLPLSGDYLCCTDPVVEGKHFAPGTEVERVAHKLVHRNFSDLAAMAAWPEFALFSFCFGPKWGREHRRAFYRSIKTELDRVGAAWVGGDLAAICGPSVFTMTVFGKTKGWAPLLRSGLAVGDLLFVTGPLGGSLYQGRHLDFDARLQWALRLASAHAPTAMIDLSDGLALDLSRMLAASGALGASLHEVHVPLHEDALAASDGSIDKAREAAFFDGEDYELLFGMREEGLKALAQDKELPAFCKQSIGVVCARPGIRVIAPDATVRDLRGLGYQHALG